MPSRAGGGARRSGARRHLDRTRHPATAWGLDELRDAWRACCSRSHPSCSRRTPTWARPEPSWISSMSAAMPSRAAAGSASTRSGPTPKPWRRRRRPGRRLRCIDRRHAPERRLHARSTRPGTSAGADEVQEIAWMLATGVAMLRALEVAGLPVERAAATIGFRVAADADQFLTIARLRAARSCGGRYSPPVESTPTRRDSMPSRRRDVLALVMRR